MTTAQTCVNTQHATLATTTADSVTFSGQGSSLCVTNRDASATLWFTIAKTGADVPVTAVAAADETFVVLPLQSKTVKFRSNKISIVGSGNAYSAELL